MMAFRLVLVSYFSAELDSLTTRIAPRQRLSEQC